MVLYWLQDYIIKLQEIGNWKVKRKIETAENPTTASKIYFYVFKSSSDEMLSEISLEDKYNKMVDESIENSMIPLIFQNQLSL